MRSLSWVGMHGTQTDHVSGTSVCVPGFRECVFQMETWFSGGLVRDQVPFNPSLIFLSMKRPSL
jgi:hypothetical protein